MKSRNTCLVLTQYRNQNQYNNFLGKYYHFPGSDRKSYLKQFEELPIEFVYYEPTKDGAGEFYGYGRINKKPLPDAREKGYYFAEVEDFKKFSRPVSYKDEEGIIRETKYDNTHYDPQNAVRKIPGELLEEICLDGGIILNIESDAHLVKILGEQLIGSEEVGILELIKNAFDAEASYCKLSIENIPDLKPMESEDEFSKYQPGPVIVIDDDGIGMDSNTIKNGWLRPASPIKTNIKEKLKDEQMKALKSGQLGNYESLVGKLRKEHKGRIPLGEKGVGRFAAHRLGRFLELRTKTKDFPYELVLKIDWNRFDALSDGFVNLNSIGIGLFREKPSRDYGKSGSGTRLIIYGGRDGFLWTEEKIEGLNRSILGINSPHLAFDYKKGNDASVGVRMPFKVDFKCPQCKNLSTKLIYEESRPNFSFDVLIDENGIVDTYTLKFRHPNQKLPDQEWNGKGADLRIDDEAEKGYWERNGIVRKPQCGLFYMHMDVWYRRAEWIDLSDYKDLTSYLDDFGGMSIYRDGILVFDSKIGAETDWLHLNTARIKHADLLSYRDFIGNIEIDQAVNLDLVDKTSREGMIENQAFEDLAHLAKRAIYALLVPHYKGKRDEYANLTKGIIGDSKRLNDLARTSSTFFANVADSDYPLQNDPYSFFQNLWEKADERKAGVINLSQSMKRLQDSIKMLENTQQLFVEQAGFGIAVGISLHEITKITTNFYNGILYLLENGTYDKLNLETLKDTSKSLKSELKRLSPLRAIRNEKNGQFNILESIKYAYAIFERKLDQEGISFEIINPDENFALFGRYTTINQVFGNLLDNSIYWMQRDNGKRPKLIKILLDKKYRTVTFGDNGSDINEVIRPYLFQAGYSLKSPPSGLGLYICKAYLNVMNARIYETPRRERMKDVSGAQFTMDFSRTSDGERQDNVD